MSDLPEELALAAEFPPSDRQEWLRAVKAALKDRPFDSLVRKTYDDLSVHPLYERAVGASVVAGRPAGQPWQVLQRIDHPDPASAKAQALDDLQNGATGLALIFAGSTDAHGYGIDGSVASLGDVLHGVHLDAGIALELDLSAASLDACASVAALVERRGLEPAACAIRFGLDPLGAMARQGGLPARWEHLAETFARTIGDLAARGFAGPFAVADGRPVHAAGGSEAQELAFVLSNAVAYLRALTDSGMPLDRTRSMIHFRLTADADQFLTLAKFRAFRKLWARIEDASGLSPAPAFVTGVTAWRMMTARDPYVNLLRATLAVAAAGLGGADAVVVLPFTLALGLPDAFARRAARNFQLVLLEESNLHRVADPAAGSGGIEAVTIQLAQAAWSLFQEIEAAGGAQIALQSGLIQNKISVTRAARQVAVARRKEAITGVSDYPNLSEPPVGVLDLRREEPFRPATHFDTLPEIRLAEPFEALRDRSDAILNRAGARPKVFLATLGKLSDFNARATFARNLYEAGGIEAVSNDGFNSLDGMVSAFKKSGARIACLCSSDRVYAADAERTAAALKLAGAVVHLAGRPGEHEYAWNKAGISTYIYSGCDVLAILHAVHEILDNP